VSRTEFGEAILQRERHDVGEPDGTLLLVGERRDRTPLDQVAGAGLSVLPTYLCTDDIATGRLVTLHDPPMTPLNTLYLAIRAGTPATTAVRTVHDHLLTIRTNA
jgi:hypothetical protein